MIFLIFANNIDCRYTLEPPRRGVSYEYPQSLVWSKNKKTNIPLYILASYTIQKSGFRGYILNGRVFQI